MQREGFDMKLQSMINDGVRQVIFSPTGDTTLTSLKEFQDFLRQNFKGKYDRYEDMRAVSNQPGKIYATAKTHKFDSLVDIAISQFKVLSFVQ